MGKKTNKDSNSNSDLNCNVDELAQKLHIEMFPEEYDFMYDSNVDASERAKGKNPMRQEYIEKVSARRKALGILPLGPDGKSQSNDSWRLCHRKAKEQLGAEGSK